MTLNFSRLLWAVFVLLIAGIAVYQAAVLHQTALVIVSVGLVIAAIMPELKGLK